MSVPAAAPGRDLPDEVSPPAGRPAPDEAAALARFAAGIAHELRNPLAVILGRTQLLDLALQGGDPVPPERIREALRAIEEQALRASTAIETLAGLARPRTLHLGEVDLAEAVRQVLAGASQRHPQARLATEVEIAEGARVVTADRGQLVAALTHLVLNAVEAMPAGGRLTVRAGRGARGIDITVADTGSGVAEHVAGHIFEPFFSTKPKAAGLGLCVAQAIARAHQGSVRLHRPGPGGAEFTLTLPSRGAR